MEAVTEGAGPRLLLQGAKPASTSVCGRSSGRWERAMGEGLNPFDDEPHGKRDLPGEHRDCGDQTRRGGLLVAPEQHGDCRAEDQGTSDKPQYGDDPWHKARLVHQ